MVSGQTERTLRNPSEGGWTPYIVYTTEILSFLHNRSIISNGKRSFKNQISVRLDRGSFASCPLDQRELVDKNDNF